jgi:hypothetical protein
MNAVGEFCQEDLVLCINLCACSRACRLGCMPFGMLKTLWTVQYIYIYMYMYVCVYINMYTHADI